MNAIVYVGLTMSSGTLAGSMYLNMFLMGIVEIPAIILPMFILDRLGRRLPYVAAMLIGGATCLSAIVVLLTAPGEYSVIDGYDARYLRVVGYVFL